MRALARLVAFAIRTVVLVAAVGLGAAGVLALGADEADPPAPVLLGAAVALLIVWQLLRRGVGPGGMGSTTVPATIMRIWQDPRPGAPGIYWTFVLFDVRGERVKVHLSKAQARRFLESHSTGDVGRISYRGDKLIAWEPASAEKPVAETGVSAFISYERSWIEDARYVASFLESRGVDTWIDTERLHAGDRLNEGVRAAIARADVFIPILSGSYLTSVWCLREMEAATRAGTPVRPVKVEEGDLLIPPHLRRDIGELLDSTVYVDLRGREPIVQLDQFAASLSRTG